MAFDYSGNTSGREAGCHVRARGADSTVHPAPARAEFVGWCDSHPCVTALAATANEFDGRLRALDSLIVGQEEDGSWAAYWWCDESYTTALACEALVEEPIGRPSSRARSAAWAAARIGADGAARSPLNGMASAFATANCLRTLTCVQRHEEHQQRAVRRLIEIQDSDGGWPSSAELRIPPPGVTDPATYPTWSYGGRGGGSIQTDKQRCFTTATVLEALLLTVQMHS